MERIKIIKELAQYEHPSNYHNVITWTTEKLKKLLDTYKSIERGDVVVYPYIHIGIDYGYPKVTENIKNLMKFKH